MSENDKDPQQGEFRDPTASPDWQAPASSRPTEQIPQGGEPAPEADVTSATDRTSEASSTGGDEAQGPSHPAYDAPYAPPRAASDPYAGSSAQPTNPYAATPPPPPAGPYGATPYDAGQPAYDPYAATGGQAQPGGYPAYQAPGQWQAPPAAYGAPAPQNTSAVVLTILSGLGLVLCCQFIMIGSLVLGIMGLTKNTEDPEGAARLTKIGWVVFGISIALTILGIVAFFVMGAYGVFDDPGMYDSDYDTY